MSELQPSELGTQEFWDNQYKLEIENFKQHGDVGEVWFGENIGKKIIRWLDNSKSVAKSDRIIDIGCGNGMLLVELAETGYTNLLGVDYSDAAIKLAEDVAKEHQKDIQFQICDLLAREGLGLGEFRVVLDKGTYDAISLSEGAKDKRLLYIENVFNILTSNGLFIITSCNWTKIELEEHFKDKFETLDIIPTPQFQFGGSKGNTITSVAFKKL